MSDTAKLVKWAPSGRGKAQCAPNPHYPDGIAIDATEPGEKSCFVELPYPAPECGTWIISCSKCQMHVHITAAGRPDDPISVRIACRPVVQ